MALAGMLLRSEWPLEDVKKLVTELALLLGHDEDGAAIHMADAELTLERLNGDEPTFGTASITALIGWNAVEWIRAGLIRNQFYLRHEAMQEKRKVLRAVLGQGPADLLVFLAMIADSDGFAKIAHNEIRGYRNIGASLPTIIKWNRKLVDAGLVRVDVAADDKEVFLYQLRGTESLPLKECVEEFLEEEPGFVRVREQIEP